MVGNRDADKELLLAEWQGEESCGGDVVGVGRQLQIWQQCQQVHSMGVLSVL